MPVDVGPDSIVEHIATAALGRTRLRPMLTSANFDFGQLAEVEIGRSRVSSSSQTRTAFPRQAVPSNAGRPLSGTLFRSVPLDSAFVRETLACRRRLARNTTACRGPWLSPRTATGCSSNPHWLWFSAVHQSSPPLAAVCSRRKTAPQAAKIFLSLEGSSSRPVVEVPIGGSAESKAVCGRNECEDRVDEFEARLPVVDAWHA